jgi:hypothetical protein
MKISGIRSSLTGTLRSAVDKLGALMVGEDPLLVESVAAKLRTAAARPAPAVFSTWPTPHSRWRFGTSAARR